METSRRKHKEYRAGHWSRQELSEQSARITGTSPGRKDGHNMKIKFLDSKGDYWKLDMTAPSTWEACKASLAYI